MFVGIDAISIVFSSVRKPGGIGGRAEGLRGGAHSSQEIFVSGPLVFLLSPGKQRLRIQSFKSSVVTAYTIPFLLLRKRTKWDDSIPLLFQFDIRFLLRVAFPALGV